MKILSAVLCAVVFLSACGGGGGGSGPLPGVDGTDGGPAAKTFSVAKYDGYKDQSFAPGASGVVLAVLQVVTEDDGFSVENLEVVIPSDASGWFQNLKLVDGVTDSTVGNTIASPGQSNEFAVDYTVPAFSVRIIRIVADVKSGVSPGLPTTLSIGTKTTAVDSVTGETVHPSSPIALQTVTITSSPFTVGLGPNDPTSGSIAADGSYWRVGEFGFYSESADSTVDKVSVVVAKDVATKIQQIAVSYRDANGVAQNETGTFVLGSETATATFENLAVAVPEGGDGGLLEVYVVMKNGTSGSLRVGLSGAEDTFHAFDTNGDEVTSVNGGSLLLAGGSFTW